MMHAMAVIFMIKDLKLLTVMFYSYIVSPAAASCARHGNFL